MSSDFMTQMSTPFMPIEVSDGFHCSDLISDNGAVDPTVLKVQQEGLKWMKRWLADWEPNPFGDGWPMKA